MIGWVIDVHAKCVASYRLQLPAIAVGGPHLLQFLSVLYPSGDPFYPLFEFVISVYICVSPALHNAIGSREHVTLSSLNAVRIPYE
jgi:hypothetical protein